MTLQTCGAGSKAALNVLVLIGRFDKDSGGAQRAIVNQINASRSDSVRYTVCHFSGSGSAAELLADGVSTVRLDVRGATDAQVVRKLRALVRERRIDVIHTQSPLSGIWSRIAYAFDRSVPLVASEQNTHQRYRSPTGLANGLTLPRADRIVCVSDSVRQSFFIWEKWLLRRRQLDVVHNAIDPAPYLTIDRPRPPGRDKEVRAQLGAHEDGTVLIGNVARLDPQKNQRHLLHAFARISDRAPTAVLAFVGGGALLKMLESEARTLGIAERVVFAGRRSDMLAVYAALDVLVLPSRHEGFSLALLEAMASGLPVACSSIPEIVEATGGACLASDPRAPAALANDLERLADDSDLRLSLGDFARRRVTTRFDAATMAASYETLYADLVGRTSRRSKLSEQFE